VSEEKIPDPEDLIYLAGGDIDEVSVSFCIYGDDLKPILLSELLGIEPSQSHQKGETHGVDNRAVWRTGAWIYKVTAKAPVTPEDLVAELLDLMPARPALWEELVKDYRVVVRFGLYIEAWNREFEISPALVSRLATIGAELDFDIYAEEPREGH
jgi:hypothetical protein